MSFQDWDEVSWDKRGKHDKNLTKEQKLRKAQRTGNVTTSKKFGGPNNKNTGSLNTKTLDDDHESTQHVKISVTLKKVLQQERTKAKMSQKELVQFHFHERYFQSLKWQVVRATTRAHWQNDLVRSLKSLHNFPNQLNHHRFEPMQEDLNLEVNPAMANARLSELL